MSAISAHLPGGIEDRRVQLNFGIASVGAVLKCAAYNLCGRVPDRLTDQTFDFTRKQAEHYDHFSLFPEHVTPTENLTDPATFWRDAESAERRADGQLARQILFGIPRGLPVEHHRAYISHVFRPLIEAGMAVHFDCHNAPSRDGGENRHVHALLTMRRLTPDGTFDRKKAREWNALFQAGKGRVMRAQFEQRGNEWLEEHGYNVRLRIRSNEELDGPDALPPEPHVSRADIEATKRHPETPSPAIISLDEHRRLRKHARESQTAARALSAEIVSLQDRQRLHATGAHDMARNKNGWQAGTGGYEALSPGHQASARIAYNKWRERHGGRPGDTVFSLPEYVDFVQARRREDKGWRFERPDADANAMHRSDPPTEIIDTDAPAPEEPRQQQADADDDMSDDDGWDRETRFRARLLAGHYKISESSLTPEQVAAISNIRLDRRRGVATIELHTGDTFEDFGDRIVSPRDPSPETAAELARAAQFHGWSHVALTGTPAYRDEVSIALALLEPPVGHDWKLSREAQARLDEALAARLAAFENTNAIRPVEAPANEMQAEPAPVAEVVEPTLADLGDGPDAAERAEVAADEAAAEGPEPTYAVIFDADPIARGLSLEAAQARAAAEGLTDADITTDAQYDEDIARLDAQHEADMQAEARALGAVSSEIPVPAVVLRDGTAVSIEWLQANRDAYADMTDAEIREIFPSFDGYEANPAAYQDDPSGGEDLDHATEVAEQDWREKTTQAIGAWEASEKSLADVPEVAPRTLFITNPRDPSGDYDAADMRERPELAAVRDRTGKMSNEALERRLSAFFPHYNPDSDNPNARTDALTVWRAARAAKKENAHAHENESHPDARTPGADGPDGRGPGGPAPASHGAHAGAGMDDVRPVGPSGDVRPDPRNGGADVSRPDGAGQPAPLTREERIKAARAAAIARQNAEAEEQERRAAMDDNRPDFDGPDF